MKINYLRDQTDFIMKVLVNNGIIYTGKEGIIIPNEILADVNSKFNNFEAYINKCNIASIESNKIVDLIRISISDKSEFKYKGIQVDIKTIKSKIITKFSGLSSAISNHPKFNEHKEEAFKLLCELNPEIKDKVLDSLETIESTIRSSISYSIVAAGSVNLPQQSVVNHNVSFLSPNIDSVIDETLIVNETEFKDLINSIHKKSGMKQFEVSRISGIHETTLSKILNGKKDDISRDMLIRLAITYKLSLSETNEMLKLKGHYLFGYNLRNLIIMLGIENQFSIDRIEEELYDRGLQTLMQVS